MTEKRIPNIPDPAYDSDLILLININNKIICDFENIVYTCRDPLVLRYPTKIKITKDSIEKIFHTHKPKLIACPSTTTLAE